MEEKSLKNNNLESSRLNPTGVSPGKGTIIAICCCSYKNGTKYGWWQQKQACNFTGCDIGNNKCSFDNCNLFFNVRNVKTEALNYRIADKNFENTERAIPQ